MSDAESLLAWYDRHQRQLPWRADRDPYRIWVSEIMLQQTRVETVIPYYQRFLDRFPSVEALAAAEVDEMLAYWSGLGYYRRGRQMHAAARQIADQGEFPRNPESLRALPGIGEYTAAAVASMAFGVEVAVLDGNVERVISRYLGEDGDPKQRAVRARLRAGAEALLVPGRPGDSNQALMELGATVCVPKRPRCLFCPLNDGCVARRAGDPERYPPPRRKREAQRERRLVVIVEQGERLLLFRRADSSELLAGTWELPWVDLAGEAPADRAAAAHELGRRYGGRWQIGEQLGEVRHGITYRDITAEVYGGTVDWGGRVEAGPAAGFYSAAEREALALSSLVTKAAAAARRPPADRSRSPVRRRA